MAASWPRLSRALHWLDRHPLRKLAAYVVAAVGGITILVTAFHALQVAIDAPRPMPGIVQITQLSKGDLRVDPNRVAVEVVLENPTERPLVVTNVRFRTAPAPTWIPTSGAILPAHVYRLPLSCRTKDGEAPLYPPFGIDPKSAAAFVIEGDRSSMACTIFLTFATNQGTTGERVAQWF